MPQPKTVLIVDDDPMTRRAIVRTLGDPALRLLQAESSDEALGILATEDVHVVVSDHHLGDDDTGTKLLSIVAARYPNVVRILLTSDVSSNVLVGAVNDGRARRVVYKPWNDEQLIGTVRQALGISRFSPKPAGPPVYTLKPMGRTTLSRLAAIVGIDVPNE